MQFKLNTSKFVRYNSTSNKRTKLRYILSKLGGAPFYYLYVKIPRNSYSNDNTKLLQTLDKCIT